MTEQELKQQLDDLRAIAMKAKGERPDMRWIDEVLSMIEDYLEAERNDN